MNRHKFSYIFYIIIALAVTGFVSQIFINPSELFRNILIMIGMSAVILAVFYFIFVRKRSNINQNEMKKYKQAVKQSQQKYQQHQMNQQINFGGKKQQTQTRKKNRRRASHLRVIDGTGGKQNEKNESHMK